MRVDPPAIIARYVGTISAGRAYMHIRPYANVNKITAVTFGSGTHAFCAGVYFMCCESLLL